MGTYAEYKCLPEDSFLILKTVKYNVYRGCGPFLTAFNRLYFLRERIYKRTKNPRLWASGSIGHSLVQLGKYFGANVTGICSTSNLDCECGADTVIDYTQRGFYKQRGRYDIIFDAVPARMINRKA